MHRFFFFLFSRAHYGQANRKTPSFVLRKRRPNKIKIEKSAGKLLLFPRKKQLRIKSFFFSFFFLFKQKQMSVRRKICFRGLRYELQIFLTLKFNFRKIKPQTVIYYFYHSLWLFGFSSSGVWIISFTPDPIKIYLLLSPKSNAISKLNFS